jgi:hypothetical protein
VAVRAVGLAAPTSTGRAARPGGRGRAIVERDAAELLRCVAEGVGLLRSRGDRLEATSLRHAWAQIDQTLRAGLTYAAWCQQVTLTTWPGPPTRRATAWVHTVLLGQSASCRSTAGRPPPPSSMAHWHRPLNKNG